MIVLLLLNNLLEWDRGTKIYTFASRKQARVVAHSRCSVKGGGITDALQPDGILSVAFTMCGFYSGPSFSSLGSFVVAERVQGCVSSSFLSHPFHTTASLVSLHSS